MTRRAVPEVIYSTTGQANPAEVDKPYRWNKRPGWRPQDVQFREAGTRRPGPPPGSPNSTEAKRERFARFCDAMDAGASFLEAGKAAGVAAKTARRYRQEREQQREEGRDA